LSGTQSPTLNSAGINDPEEPEKQVDQSGAETTTTKHKSMLLHFDKTLSSFKVLLLLYINMRINSYLPLG
jgi:hypothetical protein